MKKNLFKSRVSTKFDEHCSFKAMRPTHFWQATACNLLILKECLEAENNVALLQHFATYASVPCVHKL